MINTDNLDKFDNLKRLLEEHANQSVIIYGACFAEASHLVRKKDEAETVKEVLCQAGFKTTLYHASLSVGFFAAVDG